MREPPRSTVDVLGAEGADESLWAGGLLELALDGGLRPVPAILVAAVHARAADHSMIVPEANGIEAAGEGLDTGHHAAPLCAGKPGVLHGNRTYLMEDINGQIIETHSVSAGLDYPGVGPEHSWLKDSGRVRYDAVTDKEALQGFHDLTRIEGIIPALESSHALAYVTKLAPTMRPDQSILVNLSGRGDKDMHTVAATEGIDL